METKLGRWRRQGVEVLGPGEASELVKGYKIVISGQNIDTTIVKKKKN